MSIAVLSQLMFHSFKTRRLQWSTKNYASWYIDTYLLLFLAQGTLIRVFDTQTKNLLVELRRGADPATLYWYVIHFYTITYLIFI